MHPQPDPDVGRSSRPDPDTHDHSKSSRVRLDTPILTGNGSAEKIKKSFVQYNAASEPVPVATPASRSKPSEQKSKGLWVGGGGRLSRRKTRTGFTARV